LVCKRVKLRVGVILECASVEGVGAALGHVVNYGTRVAPVFHAEVIGNDVELGDDVLIADEDRGPGNRVVVVRLAINLEVVGAATLPVYRKVSAIVVAEPFAARRNHSRSEVGEHVERAIQRQISHRLALKSCGDLGTVRLNQRCATFNRDYLGGTDRECASAQGG